MAERQLETISLDAASAEIESKGKSLEFAPRKGIQSIEGDCVFIHLEDVPHYAERVDDLLTAYCALDDNRLVGLQIKGISTFPRNAGFEVQFGTREDTPGNRIELVQLLLLTFTRQQKITGALPRGRNFDRYYDALGVLSRAAPVRLDMFNN